MDPPDRNDPDLLALERLECALEAYDATPAKRLGHVVIGRLGEAAEVVEAARMLLMQISHYRPSAASGNGRVRQPELLND